MAVYEAVTMIQAPADQVWSYAADIQRHPEWMSATDARTDRGTGTTAGDRGRERVALGPLKLDLAFEVGEAVPARRLAWRAIGKPGLEYEVALDFEAIDAASTRATYRATVDLHGRWRLIAPLLAMEGPGAVKRELGLLKERIEQGAAAEASEPAA
jgi:uncharacterized membrane protein